MRMNMTQTQDKAVFDAIRDAVEAAVAEFGIDFVRTLSMFPSTYLEESVIDKAA